MSNVTAMECTKDRLYVRGADGREWSITRTEILEVYARKTGNAASRRTQTITDIQLSLIEALGVDQVPSILLDFDPSDSLKTLLLVLS